MVRNLLAFLVLVGFVFSIVPVGPTSVDYCQEIRAPGEYTLTKDLTDLNDSNRWCLRISSSNVTLDCDGHTLTGNDTGTGIEVKADPSYNITVKNCDVSHYEFGGYIMFANSSLLDNDFHHNINMGCYMDGQDNEVEGNLFRDNTKPGASGFYSRSAMRNVFTDNKFYNNERTGAYLGNAYGNEFYDNFAYDNGESGFYVSGYENVFEDNTAYGNDWEYYEGGGFELGRAAGNVLNRNTAYDNTNGFYIEGVMPELWLNAPQIFGNTFTNNHAYGNLVGLNFIDWNGTYTDNILEENYEADMLVGGDYWITGTIGPVFGTLRRIDPMSMVAICENTVEDNTGSGERPILFVNERVSLSDKTYSELILCNASESRLSLIRAEGSEELDNNGILLIFSNDTEISRCTSRDNFMGFGFLMSPGSTLENSDSSGSGFGIVAQRSRDLTISGHTSDNNRMNSTIILELLLSFVGNPLQGDAAALRSPAPQPDFPEMGAGMLLTMSPRTTIENSEFSGSTFGVMLVRSDEVTISRGSAHDNDVFGYGMLDSYNVLFTGESGYGPEVYSNDGDVYDIFGDRTIPPQYEMLQYLPLGAGVFDLSTNILVTNSAAGEPLGLVSRCINYYQCDVRRGYICNFTSNECEKGTFENRYYGMRVHDNNYGLVLLNLGHEVVDHSRVYDNHVFGLLDLSNPAIAPPPAQYLGVYSVTGTSDAVIINRSSFYRNGEELFSTFQFLFEEAGREMWAEGFEVLDESLKPGVFELEIIEASYFNSMLLPAYYEEGSRYHWQLDRATLGEGTVTISLDDNATALYILSDTNLPTQKHITIKSPEFDLDTKIYLEFDGSYLGPRVPFRDSYFMVGAVNEAPLSLGADEGPSISTFQVHYGPSREFNASTVGLYRLEFPDGSYGVYCEEDVDCAGIRAPVTGLRDIVCSHNMCVPWECDVDANCTGIRADQLYCDEHQCVNCLDDADCTGGYACGKCVRGSCIDSPLCLVTDIDCNEACLCNQIFDGSSHCMIPHARGTGATAAPKEVTLRAITLDGQDIIVNAMWVPVPFQVNDVGSETITVYNLSQRDRTAFIEQLLGMMPLEQVEGFRFYGDVYGLFGAYEPGGGQQPGGGDDNVYECERDEDCPECYFCGIEGYCEPQRAAECYDSNGNYPEVECQQGLVCTDCTCLVPEEVPECTSDRECRDNEYCDDGECVPVPCECGEVKDHECIAHECCSDDECGDLICKDHKCVEPEGEDECDECEEPIAQTEEILDDLGNDVDTSHVEDLLGQAKDARDRGDCEEAVRLAEEALAAARDLLKTEDQFPAPVISTEVPSVEDLQMPNGKEVTEFQYNIAWIILILLGLGLILFWYFKNHYGKK